LVDAEGAGFDDALFQTPTLRAGGLKIQIGVIDLVLGDLGQGALQVAFIQTKRREQDVMRNALARL
jgi:hypothetical protein